MSDNFFTQSLSSSNPVKPITLDDLKDIAELLNPPNKKIIVKYGRAWPDKSVTFYNSDDLPVIYTTIEVIRETFENHESVIDKSENTKNRNLLNELGYFNNGQFIGIPIYGWPGEEKKVKGK